MSGEIGGKPREYEVMSANNGSREIVSRKRVWSTISKDFREFTAEGKLVIGV